MTSFRWKSAAAKRILKAGGAATVEEAVESVAERLLEGIPCPPTDLAHLATSLDVKEIRYECLPVAGLLKRDTDRKLVLLVDEDASAQRQRFTIAHELGHAFFETTGPHPPMSGEELERICDKLAARLLMPTKMMRLLSKRQPSPGVILDIANEFNVSLVSAAIRAHEVLGLHFLFAQADGTVHLARGVLREIDEDLLLLVKRAFQDSAVQEIVRLNRNKFWNGDWNVAGKRLHDRALFVFSPIIPDSVIIKPLRVT